MIKKIWEALTSKGKEQLSGSGFHAMALAMKIMDRCTDHSTKQFATLGLEPRQTVVDYGCGPGRCLPLASSAVGLQGSVYAVDIHPIAIQKVERLIEKERLVNVFPVLADGYTTRLDDGMADVVYALEVFHMIERPAGFLGELSRLVKNDGIVIVDDGHQSRPETVRKVEQSGVLAIEAQTPGYLRCRKIGSGMSGAG